MTSRLIVTIIDAFRKVLSASEIAARYNISTTTAIRYFDIVNYRCGKLPAVLSIDEFKGNAGGQKYQTILTDLEQKKVADILPNRYESDLIRYFKQFSSRTEVKYFVCDLNSTNITIYICCFPKNTRANPPKVVKIFGIMQTNSYTLDFQKHWHNYDIHEANNGQRKL